MFTLSPDTSVMIGYITLGSNDLKIATAFYDALLGDMGAERAYQTDALSAWRFKDGGPLMVVNAPFDEREAVPGNGNMVALKVEDIASVDRLHARAIQLGATDEGAPGPRGGRFYGGYFRDPDGNKLNFHCNE